MYGRITQVHLDLIARIYELPLDPAGWPGVLDDFARLMNAAMAATAVYDPIYSLHHLNAITSDPGPSFLEEQRRATPSGYRSAFAKMAENPRRGFVSDKEMFDLKDYEAYAERPLVQWFHKNYNLYHGAASCLNLDRAWTDILFVMFSADRGPVSGQEKMIGNLFLDHFAKSTELGRAFGVLKSRFDSALAALDRFHIGIFVVSPDGAVVLDNAEAERIVDAGDGLNMSPQGRLRPSDHGHRAELREAIAKAAYTAQAQDSRAESLMTLPRPSGADPYLVEVSPICDKDEIESDFRGALVFVIDPNKTDVVSTERMQTLYSLTKSESEVCKLLAEGSATDDIAEARNLTRETVRNYIKQVLRKTGTKNRSQLVRLALSVNLPIDPAPRGDTA